MSNEQYLRAYSLDIVTPQGEKKELKNFEVKSNVGGLAGGAVASVQVNRAIGLRINFDIIKSTLRTPNLATITITNPNDDTLSFLSEEGTKVALNVGYGSNLGLIFKGTVTNVLQPVDRNNRYAVIYSRDGIKDWETATITRTFKETVSPDEILSEIIKEFSDLNVVEKDDLPKTLENLRGFSASGMAKDAIDKVLKKFDYRWHIQDEGLYIKDNTILPSTGDAVLINSTTGMINSPIVTEIGADVTTLLNPQLLPERIIKIESQGSEVALKSLNFRNVKRTKAEGFYRIKEVNFKGDSRQGEWTSSIIGESVNV